MIKTRNLLILLVVVAVLVGINLMQKAKHRQSTNRSSTETVVTGEFKADGLSRIAVGRGEEAEAVVLASTPDGWVVETAWNTPASQSRVDALLRGLSELRGEYRSDSAEVLADYGLDPDGAVQIRVLDKSGQPVIALDVGNKSERGQGNFMCRPGETAVYLSSRGVLSLLGVYGEPETPESQFFLELQAVQEDRLAVDRILLRDGDAALDLAKVFFVPEPAPDDSTASTGPDRTTWEWELAGNDTATLAKTKVDAVLGSLVNVRAADVDDPQAAAATYGLDTPTRSATLIKADGGELTLDFGNARPAEGDRQAGVWLRIRGTAPVWVVTDHTVQSIFKSLDDLQAE